MRRIGLCFLLFVSIGATAADTGAVRFDAGSLARLQRLSPGQSLPVAEFPAGPGVLTAMDFKRIDV